MELNEKQLEILLVAERLFAKQGYSGTTVRDIAKEASINIAMISYYFGSKEKMLNTLLVYRLADYKIQLQEVISNDKTFIEKLDQIVFLTIHRVHKNRRTHKIVNVEFSKGNLNGNFDKYLQQKKDNYRMIENFVKAGQEVGIFNKSVQEKLVMPTMLGSYFHFYYNKNFFKILLGINEAAAMDEYVNENLIPHIQKTIKALLIYEG